MSVPKFTPGPWVAYRSIECRWSIHRDKAIGAGIIADVRDWNGLEHLNARLIAAAPDLYEALKAQRCSQCMPDEPDSVVCDVCRLRRAALAKAEGSR
jgi:hypothetical protein